MVEYEYALLWVGGESGRPWGTKAQGFVQAPHLNRDAGRNIPNITMAAGEETGNAKTLDVDVLLVVNEWVGAQLRIGTPAIPLEGYATVVSNTATTVTVDWVQPAAASGTVTGYFVRPAETHGTTPGHQLYEEVRVLVPYQPEGDGTTTVPYPAGLPDVPPTDNLGNALVLPTPITLNEDWGLFLPFTFKEGIAGTGLSDATDSYTAPQTHVVSGVSPPDATTFTWINGTGDTVVVNSLAGGYIRVRSGASLENLSWARIATNTATVITLDAAGWLGVDPPVGGTEANWLWEAWAPHYDNNPYAYLPGVGFRYPNNDMQPSSEGNGEIRNMAQANATAAYGDRFGAMLEFGWRMSAALGKRMNMIQLCVNETTFIPRTGQNLEGFAGTLGWWDSTLMTDWSTSKATGLAIRLKKMVDTIAPNALLAEGSTKVLRILGIVMNMGEEDATQVAGRESYSRSMPDFIEWLRDVIDDAGLNPYDDNAKIPVVHPLITEDPWESVANDEDKLVNSSILEIMEADGFGATIDVESSTKLTFDTEHYSGVGEGLNGNLASLAMQVLVNRGLAYGSEIVEDTRQREIDICCRALALIGETEITSLDVTVDTSRRAKLCNKYFPQARDSLLQSRQWGFAMRRKTMISAAVAPTTWLFSYVVPPETLKVFSVLPIGATADSDADYPFEVEQSSGGHRLVYTDVEDAQMRYVVRMLDATKYSEMFVTVLSLELAALLAGPFLKGRAGAVLSERMTAQAQFHLGQAASDDANQRMTRIDYNASWIEDR